MHDIHDIPLASIEVGVDRARNLDPVWAEGLAGIIAAQGLMSPILVRAIDGEFRRYRLVAGLHRIEAFRHLGRETIPAYLSEAASNEEARLQEVMENLGRAELIALDRCHHLFELKQVWERMHPEARNGGDKNVQKGRESTRVQTLHSGDEGEQVFGFAEAVADRIGLSKRSIFAAVKIWRGLAPPTRARLVGTDLATKQTELKALSEIVTPGKQAKVLDLILGGENPEIRNIDQALAFLKGGSGVGALEKQYRAVQKAFSGLPPDAFDMVISSQADRVIESLKRIGRI